MLSPLVFLIEFTFVILEYPVLFVSVDPFQISFVYPFLNQHFLVHFFHLYYQFFSATVVFSKLFHSMVFLSVFISWYKFMLW